MFAFSKPFNKQIIKFSFQGELLDVASTSMIKQPDFYAKNDNFRVKLLQSVHQVKDLDPEFILKVCMPRQTAF